MRSDGLANGYGFLKIGAELFWPDFAARNATRNLTCRGGSEARGTGECCWICADCIEPALNQGRLSKLRQLNSVHGKRTWDRKRKHERRLMAFWRCAGGRCRTMAGRSCRPVGGVALRVVPLKSGRCDNLLIVGRVPVGIIEAKKEGSTLSGVAAQSDVYARNLPDFLNNLLPGGAERLPFLYESTGVETFFRDERDPHPQSRRVFAFHRPETLGEWSEQTETLRHRLVKMPFAFPPVKDGIQQPIQP